MKARAKRHLKNEEASYKEIITWLKKEQDSIPRKEVKAFMAKRPGEGDDEDENAGDEDNENGGDDDNGGDDEDGDGEDVDDAPPRQQRKQQTGSVSAAASKDIASSAASAADTSSVARAKKKGANGKDQSQFRTNEFINSSDEED